MDINECANIIEHVRGMSLRQYSVSEFKDYLRPLSEFMIGLEITLPHSPDREMVIQRGRLKRENDELVKNISDLKCKPAKDVDISRANDKGKPVFYGALDLRTVFPEIGADKGSIVQVIHIGPAEEAKHISFSVVGQIDQWLRYRLTTVFFVPYYQSHLEKRINSICKTQEDYTKLTLIDAFFADQFRKRARRPYEHKLCAAIAELYMEVQGTDGLAYPSVENRGGFNFAIKGDSFKEKCEVRKCSAWEITNYFGHGKYLWKQVADAEREAIDKDGNIKWTYLDENYRPKIERWIPFSYSFKYPATIEKAPDGRFTVSFNDLPEALTDGPTLQEAFFNASDALSVAIAGRIDDQEEIPFPSPPFINQYIIPVPVHMAAKAALYIVVKKRGITEADLATRLEMNEKEIRQLLDPRFSSKVTTIEKALKTLGGSFHLCMP